MNRHLSPLSIGYRALESAARLGWVLVVVTFGSTQAGLQVWMAALLVLGALALAGLYQFVYWQRFEYELTPDTFDIRSGVFSRRTREIPLRRVQNVDLQRNVVQRALGIVEVRLETAGGSETEARLRFVEQAEAERLRRELSRLKRGVDDDGASAPEAEPEPELLFAITPGELFVLGVTSVDLRILSLVTVVLPILAPSMASQFRDPLVSFALAAPLAAAGLVVVAAVVSGFYSVTNYWGFELRRAEDELRYERGLVQQFSGSIPLDKVQTVSISENVLARRLGYAALSVETAGYAPGDATGSQSAVPIAKRERVLALARSVEPFGPVEFERPPKRARTRYAVRYLAVVLILTAVAYGVDRFTGVSFAWFTVLGLLPLAVVGAHLKWRNLGYALCEDHFLAREGFWTRETRVVPYYRVQTVIESATVFQRRRNLATLVVDTAGGGGLAGRDARALDVGETEATELRAVVEDRLQNALREARAVRRRRVSVGDDRSVHGFGRDDPSPSG